MASQRRRSARTWKPASDGKVVRGGRAVCVRDRAHAHMCCPVREDTTRASLAFALALSILLALTYAYAYTYTYTYTYTDKYTYTYTYTFADTGTDTDTDTDTDTTKDTDNTLCLQRSKLGELLLGLETLVA